MPVPIPAVSSARLSISPINSIRQKPRRSDTNFSRLFFRTFRPVVPVQTTRISAPICQAGSADSADSTPPKIPTRTVSAAAILLVLNAFLTAIPTLCAMLICAPLLLFERRKRVIHGALMRSWLRLTLFTSGFRVHVTGTEHIKTGTLVMANRQSALDVLALATLPSAPRFVLPTRALLLPIVGWVLRLAGCIPMRGTDRKSASKALEEVALALGAGASVTLFPEGKPGKNGTVGRFLTPAFKVARDGAPVVPVSVSGGWDICKGGVVPARWGAMSIVIHPPLAPANSDKELAAAAFEAINTGLPPQFRS